MSSIIKRRLARCALAFVAVLFLLPAQAKASVIELQFTGFLNFFGDPARHPFIVGFEFDTTQGVFGPGVDGYDHLLTGNLIVPAPILVFNGDSIIKIDGLNIAELDTYRFAFGLPDRLLWDDDFSLIKVALGAASHTFTLTEQGFNAYGSAEDGFWQFGVCPSRCAVLTTQTLSIAVDGVGVPAPVVGAGIPGLILAGSMLVWWRRRNRQQLRRP